MSARAFTTNALISRAWETLRFVDVRASLQDPLYGRKLFNVSRLPGAVFADLETDLADHHLGLGRHPLPDIQRFRSWVEKSNLGAGDRIVCYDDNNGGFAGRLWWMLRTVGFDDVVILEGGIQSWTGPTAFGTPDVPPRKSPIPDSFPLSWELGRFKVINMDTLREGHTFFDCRSPERYTSCVRAIAPDTIPGHIPEAHGNLFWASLKPFDTTNQTRQKLEEITKTTPSNRPLAMHCGSGVTACFAIACFDHYGLPPPALFVGSWSEAEKVLPPPPGPFHFRDITVPPKPATEKLCIEGSEYVVSVKDNNAKDDGKVVKVTCNRNSGDWVSSVVSYMRPGETALVTFHNGEATKVVSIQAAPSKI